MYENLGKLLEERIYEYRCNNPINGKPMPLKNVASNLGVSRFVLWSWINNETLPSLSNAVAISKLLDISLDELAGRTTNEHAQKTK